MVPPKDSAIPAEVHVNNTEAGGQVQNLQEWKSGSLFDCFNDPYNTLVTFCCPCLTFGQIAGIVDKKKLSCVTCGMMYGLVALCIAAPCLVSCTYRTKLRRLFGIVESPAPDWVVHCFCECCALCQEYRELKERGLDPSAGWTENMVKIQEMQQQQQQQQQQRQQIAMVPPMNQSMME